MSGPIVFISHNTVKDGKLEGFREAFGEVADAVNADKPGTVVYLAFADEGGSQVSVVHVFPDAVAMGQHLHGVQERMAKAVGFIQTTGYEIYGAPSEPVLEAMRCFAEAEGVPLEVQRGYLGGYLRLGE
jgi:quinol monooxygenase YgiN